MAEASDFKFGKQPMSIIL